jgi:hypothetical protein
MSKSVFRPFWSIDIIKTENWLSKMSNKGYDLKEIKSVTKVFIFENGESNVINYRICRHKSGMIIESQSLIRSGWYTAFTKGKWSILANENEKAQIKVNPSRENLLNRNRILKYAIGTLLAIYLMMSVMPMILIMAIFSSSNNDSSKDVSMSGANVSILIILLVLTSLIYLVMKLNKSDKKLRMENGIDLDLSFTIPKDTILNHNIERNLRNDGKIIKKIKPAWFYAPDKAERWLENMETKGYNLYRMSRLGNTFYFMKGEPKNVKYCLDYQNITNNSYFEIHKSNGWKMIFTSFSSFTKHTLWRKEYLDEKPELYSDKNHALQHARKQCITYCVLFIPVIIMYLLLIGSFIKLYLKGIQVPWPMPIMFSLLIVEFGYLTIITLGYYLRIRKKLS